MKKIKVALFGAVVLLVLLFGSRAFTAKAAPDFSSMSKRDYILFMMNNPGYPSDYNSYSMYFGEPGFEELHNWFVNARSENYYNDRGLRLDSSYPWELTSDREIIYIRDMRLVAHGRAGDAYNARWDRYNREHGVYEEWERQQDISANRKMWSQSQLVGNPNSHGVLTNKDNDIYQRVEEDGTVVKGTDLGAGSYNMDEPSGVTKIIMEFLCWLVFFLADGIDSILSTGGIALDNVIFGRVAGYGVLPAGETDYITLFGFELTNGNPYGYIGAMLFQRIRTYIYLFMAVYCLFKMVKIAASTDYMKMKMDFSTFIQNALLSFSFIVLMPYIFDVYLYIRDVVLKAVAFDSLQDLFGTTGFLASFRAAAESSSLNIIPNLIYLGAVILSLVVAGIYIAYAMSMMVHFILFPFVCLRGIGDRNAYKEWAAEALGLTIMPLIDGILLIIPLTFSDMANGNLAFNLLSLVSCGMLLTARKQARRSLGIKDTGLDMGAMATVMGLGMMAKSLGKTVGKIGKKIGTAKDTFSQAKEDSNMADMYNTEVKEGRVEAPSAGGVGGAVGSGGINAVNLTRHANVNNFDKGPFQGKLDNATMAKLYKQRARKGYYTATKQTLGAVGSGLGGVTGTLGGFGAGVFMGTGVQAALTGMGAEAGAAIGGFLPEAGLATASGMGGLALKGVGVAVKTGRAVSARNDSRIAEVGASVDFDDYMSKFGTEILTGEVDNEPPAVVGDSVAESAKQKRIGNHVMDVQMHVAVNQGAYYDSAVNVGNYVSNPDNLMNDADFNAKVNNVGAQFESMMERVRGGEHPNVVIDGAGGLQEVCTDFNNVKKSHFEVQYSVELANNPDFRASSNDEVNTTAMKAAVEYATNGLRSDGKYMSNDFDKNFGLDWSSMRQQIIDEGARQGKYYTGSTK